MEDTLNTRCELSLACFGGHLTSSALVLDFQAIEHHVLGVWVIRIVPALERQARPFGNGPAGAIHKVRAKMLRRDMAQGAELHGHAYDPASPLLLHNGRNLAQQIGNERHFMHGGLPLRARWALRRHTTWG